MKLLFVEDNFQIRNNYRDFLSIYFKEIYETDSSKEALEFFKKYSPDVVLMDINIKGINGIEVIKKIRLINNKTKIIIMSAHKDEEYLFLAIELNVSFYLVKPVKSDQIRTAILKTIEELKEKSILYLKNNYCWHKENKELYFNGEQVNLTKNEIQIFTNFCNNSLPYFTFEDIYFTLYDDMNEFNINKVKMLIKRLRKKTSQDLFINIYGLGYKFNL